MAAAAAAVVVTAVLAWNLAQHAVAGDGKASPPVPVSAAGSPPAVHQGPVTLAAAQPAPPEIDVPKLYVTPGLGAAKRRRVRRGPAGPDVGTRRFHPKGSPSMASPPISPP